MKKMFLNAGLEDTREIIFRILPCLVNLWPTEDDNAALLSFSRMNLILSLSTTIFKFFRNGSFKVVNASSVDDAVHLFTF